MRVRNAFTLAEVLITLGIIGVVAAMTMPTLINQTNGAQYKAAYKKALSVISQAVTLNVALDDIGFGDAKATTVNSGGDIAGDDSIGDFLSKRINVLPPATKRDGHDIIDAPIADANVTLYFNDGSMFSFPKAAANCTASSHANCKGIIDVNGIKGPNKLVADNDDPTPTDVYPVVFFDQTILPNNKGARAILYK